MKWLQQDCRIIFTTGKIDGRPKIEDGRPMTDG